MIFWILNKQLNNNNNKCFEIYLLLFHQNKRPPADCDKQSRKITGPTIIHVSLVEYFDQEKRRKMLLMVLRLWDHTMVFMISVIFKMEFFEFLNLSSSTQGKHMYIGLNDKTVISSLWQCAKQPLSPTIQQVLCGKLNGLESCLEMEEFSCWRNWTGSVEAYKIQRYVSHLKIK